MQVKIEATEPIRTKGPWRTVVVATVEGNGKNVPVQFCLGSRSYGTMVNTNWEGLAVKEVFLVEGQNTISASIPDGTSQTIVVTAGPPQVPKPTETEDGKERKAPEAEPKKKDSPQYTVALEQSEPNKISDGLWGVTVTAVVKLGKNPISGVRLRFEPPATAADADQWDETDAGGIARKTYELPAGIHTITARLKETGASKPAVVRIREERAKKTVADLYWDTRGKGSQQHIDFRALTAEKIPVSGIPICITDPTISDWKEEKKTDQYGAASFLVTVTKAVTVLCATAPGCENYTIRLYNP